jgi:hypothetical protein
MLHHRRLVLLLLLWTLLATRAAAQQDSNRQLRQSLKDTDVHASWIYNDVGAGFAEAKKTGKPLLVVFR